MKTKVFFAGVLVCVTLIALVLLPSTAAAAHAAKVVHTAPAMPQSHRIAAADSCALKNPIAAPGEDPSVWYANGLYYLVQASQDPAYNGETSIFIRAASTIGGLSNASNQLIWSAPGGTDHSVEVWAPEIEQINGQWIIYFGAAPDRGNFGASNDGHRIFALTANSGDPLGSWSFFGKVQDSSNEWAIDPTVFYYNGNLYELWSGTPPGNGGNGPQQIYIAHMSDPLHVDDAYRRLIANPDQGWETSVQAIEEGPEAFIGPNNTLSIVYSANASWTQYYTLGELVYNGGDIESYQGYSKQGPIFSSGGGVYGPGHISLPVPGINGGNWVIYHAITTPDGGWAGRDVFAQPFTWNGDGTPNFGTPQGYTTFDENTQQAC